MSAGAAHGRSLCPRAASPRWGGGVSTSVFTGRAWSPTYWGASHLVELACRCGIELLEGQCPSLADYVRGTHRPPRGDARRRGLMLTIVFFGPRPKAETSMSPDLKAASAELGSGMKRKVTLSRCGSPWT